MIKKINVLLERLIALLLCLLIISSCSILPLKKNISSEDMKNSRKAVVTVIQEAPYNSSPNNSREAIVSTDYPDIGSSVSSMNQIKDVDSNIWAFQALQSLLEGHRIVQVYTDNTFRGDRAATRYEAAYLIASALEEYLRVLTIYTSDSLTKKDVESLKNIEHLQKVSTAELASLRGRVDVLDARTSALERRHASFIPSPRIVLPNLRENKNNGR